MQKMRDCTKCNNERFVIGDDGIEETCNCVFLNKIDNIAHEYIPAERLTPFHLQAVQDAYFHEKGAALMVSNRKALKSTVVQLACEAVFSGDSDVLILTTSEMLDIYLNDRINTDGSPKNLYGQKHEAVFIIHSGRTVRNKILIRLLMQTMDHYQSNSKVFLITQLNGLDQAEVADIKEVIKEFDLPTYRDK